MELYVGHLKPEVNRGDLWAAFHKFGSVNYIRLREGHAFVKFDKTADAMEALRALNCQLKRDRSHRSPYPVHDNEVVKCQLCKKDVVEADLADHIASKHLNYELHKCRRCEFRSIDVRKASDHAEKTGHLVLLNKCERSACHEKMIKSAYDESLQAHHDRKARGGASKDWKVGPPPANREGESSGEESFGEESSTPSYHETSSKSDEGGGKEAHKQTFIAPTLTELPPATSTSKASRQAPGERGSVGRVASESAGGMLLPPVTASYRDQAFTELPGHHVATAGGMLPPSATTSRQAQPFVEVPRLPAAASANAVAEQNRDPYQCQLCLVMVLDKRADHVRKEHLHTTATCPVSGCGYTVTSNYMATSSRIGLHVRNRHGGLNTLTSSEVATYKENRKRLRVDEDVYRNCFPKKERTPDYNRDDHIDERHGSLPKRTKRE